MSHLSVFKNFWTHFSKISKKGVFDGGQEKGSDICVRVG